MFEKINRQRLEDQSVNTELNQPTRTTGHYAPPQYNSSSTALDTFASLTIEDSMVPRKNERKKSEERVQIDSTTRTRKWRPEEKIKACINIKRRINTSSPTTNEKTGKLERSHHFGSKPTAYLSFLSLGPKSTCMHCVGIAYMTGG